MRIRAFICFFVSMFWMLSAVAAAPVAPKFKHIVILGDSLSDNGNLYRMSHHMIPSYPAYFEGRCSNGYVWSDDVTYDLYQKYYITSQNYAVAGATAMLHNPLGGYMPITLGMEYDDYIANNLLKNKDDTLYVIWIGANDYLMGSKDVDKETTEVVSAITSVVDKLAVIKGAQFLIVGLPDLAATPAAKERHLSTVFEELANAHDQKLHIAVQSLSKKYPAAKFMEFSFTKNPILKNIVEDPAYRDAFNKKYHLNLTDVKDACLEGYFMTTNGAPVSPQGTDSNARQMAKLIQHSPALMEVYQTNEQVKSGAKSICPNPEQHLFWDHLHPTAGMHKAIAQILLNTIMAGQ